MIFLEESKVNPIVIQLSNSIKINGTYFFVFQNETTKKQTKILLENKSVSISSYDLFEIELSKEITTNVETSFDGDIIYLPTGQYTMYVYVIDLPYEDVEDFFIDLIDNDINYTIKNINENDIIKAEILNNKTVINEFDLVLGYATKTVVNKIKNTLIEETTIKNKYK